MKTAIYISALMVFGLMTGYGQCKLEVTITNVKEKKGTLRVGLFSSDEKFLKEAVDGKVVKASADQVTVVFENLKSGQYAVSVIHDENENGDLDSNMVGIPSEGFAFGNNAMGMFGPPSFDEANVVIADKATAKQSIKLKYF